MKYALFQHGVVTINNPSTVGEALNQTILQSETSRIVSNPTKSNSNTFSNSGKHSQNFELASKIPKNPKKVPDVNNV